MDHAPLLVATADPDLLDDALRWCAAIGVTPEVATDSVAARRAWPSAAGVLVAADLAEPLARTAPPRRDGVLILDDDTGAVWPAAVALGASAVLSPADESAVLDHLGSLVDGQAEACVIGVVGAVGGAGASTLATVIATEAARRGHSSLLLDADDHSAGIDLVLGAEHAEGVRWAGLSGAGGHVGASQLAQLLPRHRDVAVLSCDRDGQEVPVEVVPDILTAATRAFDVVVADIPRHLDPFGATVLGRCTGAVVLVPEDVRCVAAARLVLDGVRMHVPQIALATARRRGGLGSGPVAEALQLPVVARIAPDRRVCTEVDHGRGPSRSRSLRRGAGNVLDLLGLGPVEPRRSHG